MSDPISSLSPRQYSYEPLRGGHALRLLKLLPGDSVALVAELHHADLSTPKYQSYEALSYTWGDPTSPHDLHCQGAIMPITRNLDMALQSLRYSDNPRWLWVDVVCIDQSNPEEKAYQIDFMRLVYSNSEQTICYIGEETYQGSQVIELAEQVARRVKETTARSKGISIDDFNDNCIYELILDREPRFLEEAYSKSESEIVDGLPDAKLFGADYHSSMVQTRVDHPRIHHPAKGGHAMRQLLSELVRPVVSSFSGVWLQYDIPRHGTGVRYMYKSTKE